MVRRATAASATAGARAGLPGLERACDLIAHLGNIHSWAATIVETGRARELADSPARRGPAGCRSGTSPRPRTSTRCSARCRSRRSPAGTSPSAPGTAGFWPRRQAHETTDARAGPGARGGTRPRADAGLAARRHRRGADVFLPRMHSRGIPAELNAPLCLLATDVDRGWTLTPPERLRPRGVRRGDRRPTHRRPGSSGLCVAVEATPRHRRLADVHGGLGPDQRVPGFAPDSLRTEAQLDRRQSHQQYQRCFPMRRAGWSTALSAASGHTVDSSFAAPSASLLDEVAAPARPRAARRPARWVRRRSAPPRRPARQSERRAGSSSPGRSTRSPPECLPAVARAQGRGSRSRSRRRLQGRRSPWGGWRRQRAERLMGNVAGTVVTEAVVPLRELGFGRCSRAARSDVVVRRLVDERPEAGLGEEGHDSRPPSGRRFEGLIAHPPTDPLQRCHRAT